MGMLAKLAKLDVSCPDHAVGKLDGSVVVTDVEGMFDSVKLTLTEAKQKLEHLMDKVYNKNDPKSEVANALKAMIVDLS